MNGTKVGIVVGLSGALGAMLGATFSPLFAVIGLLLGGVTSYVVIDFREFADGIGEAWRIAREDTPKKKARRELNRFGWKIGMRIWVRKAISWSTMTSPIGLFFGLLGFTVPHPQFEYFFLIVFTGGACVLSAAWVSDGHKSYPANRLGKEMYLRDELKKRAYNPFNVCFYYGPIFLYKQVRKLPAFARKVRTFGVTAFVLVHTDLRLLCFTDASLGGTVGYMAFRILGTKPYYGVPTCLVGALIGFTAGCILGVVNYELVSKRWLKLIPQVNP